MATASILRSCISLSVRFDVSSGKSAPHTLRGPMVPQSMTATPCGVAICISWSSSGIPSQSIATVVCSSPPSASSVAISSWRRLRVETSSWLTRRWELGRAGRRVRRRRGGRAGWRARRRGGGRAGWRARRHWDGRAGWHARRRGGGRAGWRARAWWRGRTQGGPMASRRACARADVWLRHVAIWARDRADLMLLRLVIWAWIEDEPAVGPLPNQIPYIASEKISTRWLVLVECAHVMGRYTASASQDKRSKPLQRPGFIGSLGLCLRHIAVCARDRADLTLLRFVIWAWIEDEPAVRPFLQPGPDLALQNTRVRSAFSRVKLAHVDRLNTASALHDKRSELLQCCVCICWHDVVHRATSPRADDFARCGLRVGCESRPVTANFFKNPDSLPDSLGPFFATGDRSRDRYFQT
eukprot:scaffold6742_cov118-Isochrysis_galbana.AAC.1